MPGAQMRVVDLATGSGDIPRLLVDHARKIGAQIEVDAVDQQAATLEIARRLSAGYPEISYHEANVLEWDGPQGYDIALCSLVLHHFSDDDAVKLLRRCRELSKRFVLVSDLRRGFLLRGGVYLLTAVIFREPMTRFDARLSAQRAFSFAEMRELAIQAGWKDFGRKKFRFARQAVWLNEIQVASPFLRERGGGGGFCFVVVLQPSLILSPCQGRGGTTAVEPTPSTLCANCS